jgi:hypothetical protein
MHKGLVFCLTAIAAILAAPAAHAASVTYTSTDVPAIAHDNVSGVSELTVPGGRPPEQKVEVVGLSGGTPIGSSDRALILKAPNAKTSTLMPTALCDTWGFTNTSITDDAQFQLPCSSTDPPYKPATPLAPLLTPPAGKWTMTLADGANPSGDGTISAWGLRITYAPLTVAATAVKQKVKRKSVSITATCNGDCTLDVTGGGTATGVKASSGVPVAAIVVLPKKAAKKAKAGKKKKVSLTVTATNDIGDKTTAAVTVPIKKTKKKKKKK